MSDGLTVFRTLCTVYKFESEIDLLITVTVAIYGTKNVSMVKPQAKQLVGWASKVCGIHVLCQREFYV